MLGRLCARGVLVGFALLLLAQPGIAAEPTIFFQAHRGALDEAPENTLVAIEHAWALPGAVPEVDLRTTQDGVIVCIHDNTPDRTLETPAAWQGKSIDEIPYDVLKTWDAGSHFHDRFRGTVTPTLREVFDTMRDKPERQIYLDLKAVELDDVVALIDEYDLRPQVLWVHGNPLTCRKLSELWEGSRVMTWLSGTPEQVERRFDQMEKKDFYGVSQLQFHLPSASTEPEITYAIDAVRIAECVERCATKGVKLQLRPFDFDAQSLRGLIDLGVHWYVADAPKAFYDAVAQAQAASSDTPAAQAR